jgi:Ras-related protein Rab-6A
LNNNNSKDKSSFLNVSKWIEDVREERKNEVIICLVGNKFDLIDKRSLINYYYLN